MDSYKKAGCATILTLMAGFTAAEAALIIEGSYEVNRAREAAMHEEHLPTHTIVPAAPGNQDMDKILGYAAVAVGTGTAAITTAAGILALGIVLGAKPPRSDEYIVKY